MIAMVRGTIVHREAGTVVVDVGGVGYLVHVADAGRLPAIGQEVVLHTSLQVREDSMTLYGFGDRQGLVLFDLLLSASGVGPKLALACLATMPATMLVSAIATGDVSVLTQVPGIGRKSAQRIVLELKDKVGSAGGELDDLVDVTVPAADAGPRATVSEALVGLGYAAAEVRAALDGLDDVDEEALLRSALRRLAGAPA